MIKPAGLYSHIRRNTYKSVVFIIALPVILELLTAFWTVPISLSGDAIFANVALKLGNTEFVPTGVTQTVNRTAENRYTFGIWSFLANIAISIGIIFLFGKHIVRSKTGAKSVERNSEKRLFNIIENLSITAGLPMPQIEIIETAALNSYAVGLTPASATIAVTRGLLDRLSDDELGAVMAHELSHIKNHDTKMLTVAATLLGTIISLWTVIWRFITLPTPGKIVIAIISLPIALSVLSTIAVIALAALASAAIFRAAVSKSREFMADAGAVELTKNPEAQISALKKVSSHDEMEISDPTVQAMLFSGPLGDWFDKHPTVDARINALVAYAGATRPSGKSSAHRQTEVPKPNPSASPQNNNNCEVFTSQPDAPRARRPALADLKEITETKGVLQAHTRFTKNRSKEETTNGRGHFGLRAKAQ